MFKSLFKIHVIKHDMDLNSYLYTSRKIPPSSLDIRLEEFLNSSLFIEFITKIRKIDEFGLFTLLVIKCLKQKLATPSSKSAVPRLYLSVDVQQLHQKNSRLKKPEHL